MLDNKLSHTTYLLPEHMLIIMIPEYSKVGLNDF